MLDDFLLTGGEVLCSDRRLTDVTTADRVAIGEPAATSSRESFAHTRTRHRFHSVRTADDMRGTQPKDPFTFQIISPALVFEKHSSSWVRDRVGENFIKREDAR